MDIEAIFIARMKSRITNPRHPVQNKSSMLKKIYTYIFYIFYKISLKNKSIFPSNFVAGICILALNIWLILSLLNEFYFLTDIRLIPKRITTLTTIISLVLLIGTNWYIFEYKSKWKERIREIENQNIDRQKYIFISWIIIIFVIINYWVISIYLLKVKYT